MNKKISCVDAQSQLQHIHKLKNQLIEILKHVNESEELRDKACEIKNELEQVLSKLRRQFPVRIERAEEIMGKEFLGPDAIEQTFGIKLKL